MRLIGLRDEGVRMEAEEVAQKRANADKGMGWRSHNFRGDGAIGQTADGHEAEAYLAIVLHRIGARFKIAKPVERGEGAASRLRDDVTVWALGKSIRLDVKALPGGWFREWARVNERQLRMRRADAYVWIRLDEREDTWEIMRYELADRIGEEFGWDRANDGNRRSPSGDPEWCWKIKLEELPLAGTLLGNLDPAVPSTNPIILKVAEVFSGTEVTGWSVAADREGDTCPKMKL